MYCRKGNIIISVICLFFISAKGQVPEIKSLIVEGDVKTRMEITPQQFSQFKHITIEAKDKNGISHTYEGVPVNDIIGKAGVVLDKQTRKENLSKYLLVKSADGYRVVFSLAELDPDFTDKVTILADKEDGKFLSKEKGPFKLVVPGDKIHARYSFLVTHFIIKTAKD